MNLYPPEKSEKGFSQQAAPSYGSPSYTPFSTTFASLSLHQQDRIRLLGFPESEISAIRAVLTSSWAKGIQQERVYATSYEFKLRGYPWVGQMSDAISSRVVMRELLAHLYQAGWILHATVDVIKSNMDKDTLLFRKQQSSPPPSDWISISFNTHDRLRLIGADTELINAFRIMLSSLQLLQKDCGWKDQQLGAWEFKLNGYPWMPSGEATMKTRFLVLKMMECLESHGWSLYASIDQSGSTGGNDQSWDTDSWYCVRDKSWVPGSAVFHR